MDNMENEVPSWVAHEFAWPFSRRISINVRTVLSEIEWPYYITNIERLRSPAQRKKKRLALMEHVFKEIAPIVLEEAREKHRSSAYDLTTVLPVIDFLLARLRNAPANFDLFAWPQLKTVPDMAECFHKEMYDIAREQSAQFLQGMEDDGQNCLTSLILLMRSFEGFNRRKLKSHIDESFVDDQQALMSAFLWSQIDSNAYDESYVEAANVKYAEHLTNALHAFIASPTAKWSEN